MTTARLLGVLLLILPLAAAAAEPVAVRGGVHADFGRLVFDWAEPVDYGARIQDGTLVVTFARPASFDTASAERHLFRYLEGVEIGAEGRRVTFDLEGRYGLKSFTLGPKVVVDLLHDAGQVAAKPAPQPAPRPLPRPEPEPQRAGEAAEPAPTFAATPADRDLPQIRVRVGEHAAFERLVFDWPVPVGYRLQQDVETAELVFERAARLDVSRLQANPPETLRRFADRRVAGETRVELRYVPGTRLRAFADGPRIVVDLLRPPEIEPSQPDARPELAEAPAAPPSQPAPAVGGVEGTPDTGGDDAEQQAGASSEREAGDAAGDAATGDGATGDGATGDGPTGDGAREAAGTPRSLVPQAARPPAAPSERPAPAANDGEAAPGATPESAAPAPPRPPRPAPPRPAPATETPTSSPAAAGGFVTREPLPAVEGRPTPGTRAPQTPPVLLRFAWPADVGAVALQRAGSLLLGFDHDAPVDLAAAVSAAAPELGPAVDEPVEGGSLLRFDEAALYAPRLWRDDAGWLIEFRRAGVAPVGGAPIVVEPDAETASLRIAVDRPQRLLALRDPGSGARLLLVPLAGEGQATPQGRQSPVFDLLPTYQGLALLPRLEPLEVGLRPNGVTVAAPAPALSVTGEPDEAASGGTATVAGAPRLFDLEAWRQGGAETFNERRQALQRAVVQASGDRLGLARLDLARFYFAHGLASEALGTLTLIRRETPALSGDPQLMLMEAASRLLVGDPAEAQKLLADPVLLEEPEADLWRAALAAEAQDWSAAAAQFARSYPLIDDYARAVQVRLGLSAAEATLEAGDIGAAALRLEQVNDHLTTDLEQARYDFLDALLLQAQGEADAGREILERLATSGLGAPAVQARLALIEQALAEGELTPDEAIEALEQLRFAWRGDAFEFALLQRLASLYEQQGQWRQALRSLRQAATYFPGTARAEAAAERLRELFARLFLGPEQPDLPPLSALSIYEEFRELTPAGDRGNRVIEQLADRLVAVDLLDRAARLLEGQVQFRLSGEEKARVGARLALIHLLDRKPRKALEALELSEQAGLPEGVARQRRHLQARALAGLDRGGQGLSLLEGDGSLDAQRLRAEILWAERDWEAAAVALAATLPEPADTPPDSDTSGQVLNLAVALTLAGDQPELGKLRQTWGDAMAAGPHAEAFALLAEDLDPASVATIAQQLAQVDRVQAFMATYRERLRETQLSELN